MLTDFAESQLDDWAAHPGLEDERFDFARVDLTQPIAPVLRRRGVTLGALKNPLIVIANYVFDSIPADAFAVDDGALHACLVDSGFAFTRAPVTPYGDEDLDALLEHYRVTLDDTVFTVPTVALAAIRGLRALGG